MKFGGWELVKERQRLCPSGPVVQHLFILANLLGIIIDILLYPGIVAQYPARLACWLI